MKTKAYSKKKISGHPIWGSYKEITSDTIGFLEKASEMGDIVSFRLGHRRVYGLHHPDLVKEILLSKADVFNKDGIYHRIRPVFRNGILTSKGEFWKKQRRIIQPAFTQNNMLTMIQVMDAKIREARDRILEKTRDGTPVDVFNEMLKVSMGVIAATMFSDDIEGIEDKVSDSIYFLNGYMARLIYAVVPAPPWVPTAENREYKKHMRFLDKIILDMIEKRRRENNLGTDLLGMLLTSKDSETGETMSTEQVLYEAVTIFIAGHETTATTLSWAFNLLNRNPGTRDKMLQVIDEHVPDGDEPMTSDCIRKLDYLEYIFKESLRLYPPVSVFYRNVGEDCELGGVSMKKGDSVYVAPYILHKNPEFWSDPEAFDPDRFSRDDEGHKNNYVYFPFGGGSRICIGRHFAYLEARIALAVLGKAFYFDNPDRTEAASEALVTLKPRDPLMMNVVRR